MRSKKRVLKVNASEIGRVTYCPRAMYLDNSKPRLRQKSLDVESIKRGNKAHKQYNREHQGKYKPAIYTIYAALILLGVILWW